MNTAPNSPHATSQTSRSAEEKKLELFRKQKALLDTFLSSGSISQAQHDYSLNCLIEKMGDQRGAITVCSHIAINLKSFPPAIRRFAQSRTVRAVCRADGLRGGGRGNCPMDCRKTRTGRVTLDTTRLEHLPEDLKHGKR